MASTHTNILSRADLKGSLSEDGHVWLFPQVKSVNAHGKDMFWRVYVRYVKAGEEKEEPLPTLKFTDAILNNEKIAGDYVAIIMVDSGVEGGKVRDAKPTFVKSGKNLGKKNETNVVFQALKDAQSLRNKYLIKVSDDEDSQKDGILPMLAIKWEDMVYEDGEEVFVQRKLNGIRAIGAYADGAVKLYSRGRKLFPAYEYIKADLLQLFKIVGDKKFYFDGELYAHGVNLQNISGDARREVSEQEIKCVYNVFDCYVESEPDMPFAERLALLKRVFANYNGPNLALVGTWRARSCAEVNDLYQRFLGEKYEGAIVRKNGVYKLSRKGIRSPDLAKMKPALDEEFEIVGWTVGKKGKAADSLMIICKTDEGKEFTVTPALEIKERERLAAGMAGTFDKEWKGKKITVTFDEKSKDGVPLRARTEMIVRDPDY